jgi:hypothetical protein
MALVAFVSLGLGISAAYFQDARLDGRVLYRACACGFTRATVSGGKVILAEPNHDKPAGTVVATVEIKDRMCTLRRIGKDGMPGCSEGYQVDHLGAKYYDAQYRSPIYMLMADNWKLYPATVIAYIDRLFR